MGCRLRLLSVIMTSPIPRIAARITVVGAGRLGRAIAPALAAAGESVVGPLGRHDPLPTFTEQDIVLLCVPDEEIASAATTIPRGPFVGHCAGSLPLGVLGNHHAFSTHPLLSVTDGFTGFQGAACAVAGRDASALEVAKRIAARLGMDAIVVSDALRSLYHAAASMASNYLVTIEDAAERIAAPTGLERRHLARLARSALDNWERHGHRALTGPIYRGDETTVRGQRAAVAEHAPDQIPLWDSLAGATQRLASTIRAGDSA
jgi:predicted short-subunit dehydrogenase-like oxidoreductase (DUF2520 family)